MSAGKIRICLAGATGWVGRALAPAILAAPDLDLVAAVSRTSAGFDLVELLNLHGPPLLISGSVEEGLRAGVNVLIDYTAPQAVKNHVLVAISKGVSAVIGTSGLSDDDYEEIDSAARRARLGVLAGGNFAISAVLLHRFATEAARHIPNWEIVDYAHNEKPDAPSGMTRELAHRLLGVRGQCVLRSIPETQGILAARGATINGTQIHSLRLPGYVIAAEIHFGLPDQRLTIRYEAGSGAEPYVAGTLLAAREVGTFVGLRRGLDSIMDFE